MHHYSLPIYEYIPIRVAHVDPSITHCLCGIMPVGRTGGPGPAISVRRCTPRRFQRQYAQLSHRPSDETCPLPRPPCLPCPHLRSRGPACLLMAAQSPPSSEPARPMASSGPVPPSGGCAAHARPRNHATPSWQGNSIAPGIVCHSREGRCSVHTHTHKHLRAEASRSDPVRSDRSRRTRRSWLWPTISWLLHTTQRR